MPCVTCARTLLYNAAASALQDCPLPMPTSTKTPVNDMTVVVADDDAITRGLLCAVLRGMGMKLLDEARDGAQALASTQRLRPDVLCLDIEMPGLSGLEALRKLREADKGTIVLMITGATTADNVRAAAAHGADGVIAKPFSAGKLIAEIQRAQANRSAQR
jgi:two-component system chemotaxis response regulator CheY